MPPITIPFLAAILSGFLLPSHALSEPEFWSCTRADGSTMFTNRAKDLAGCGPYAPKSELGYVKWPAEQAAPPKEERKPAAPQPPTAAPPVTINIIVNAPPPAPPKAEAVTPAGEIPFEVARMLSVGMTEAEVLGRAGLPRTTLIGPVALNFPFPVWPVFGANRFVYSRGDDWIVEVTFGGGRVISIDQTRLRP